MRFLCQKIYSSPKLFATIELEFSSNFSNSSWLNFTVHVTQLEGLYIRLNSLAVGPFYEFDINVMIPVSLDQWMVGSILFVEYCSVLW